MGWSSSPTCSRCLLVLPLLLTNRQTLTEHFLLELSLPCGRGQGLRQHLQQNGNVVGDGVHDTCTSTVKVLAVAAAPVRASQGGKRGGKPERERRGETNINEIKATRTNGDTPESFYYLYTLTRTSHTYMFWCFIITTTIHCVPSPLTPTLFLL